MSQGEGEGGRLALQSTRQHADTRDAYGGIKQAMDRKVLNARLANRKGRHGRGQATRGQEGTTQRAHNGNFNGNRVVVTRMATQEGAWGTWHTKTDSGVHPYRRTRRTKGDTVRMAS